MITEKMKRKLETMTKEQMKNRINEIEDLLCKLPEYEDCTPTEYKARVALEEEYEDLDFMIDMKGGWY